MKKQGLAGGINHGQNRGMKIGYCRVSTKEQNPDLPHRALKKAGCKTIYTDKESGALRKRTYLERCLKELKAGDVLVVWKLDRLGRSLHDLIALLDDLKERGVAFSVVDGSYRHSNAYRSRYVANGGDTGRVRKVAASGTYQGGQGCGASAGRQDGPQAAVVRVTSRACA